MVAVVGCALHWWVVAVILGLGLIGLGIPLVLLWWAVGAGRLARNHRLGLRTQAALASDEAWHAAHLAARWSFGLSGAAALVVGLGVIIFETDADRANAMVAVVFLGMLGILAVGALRGELAARRT